MRSMGSMSSFRIIYARMDRCWPADWTATTFCGPREPRVTTALKKHSTACSDKTNSTAKSSWSKTDKCWSASLPTRS